MQGIYIRNGTIVSGGRRIPNPGIAIQDGVISAIGISDLEGAEEIDAEESYIIPGMIDIHTHGAIGRDFTEGTYDAYCTISEFQASHGVTSLVATLMTMPIAQLICCANAFRGMNKKSFPGAGILGLHFEGPFLSMRNKGAQNESCIAACTPENYEKLLEFSDVLRIMTVSPESGAAIEMIRRFADAGVVISGGHDDSSEAYVNQAIAAGMKHSTHLFCAMSMAGWHEKEKALGLTEMALLHDELTTEVIADGAHTSAGMIQLAYKCKGASGMCLVSDMLSVGGLPIRDERYVCPIPGIEGGLPVIVTDKAAVLCGGHLNAGSITPLDKMLRNVVSYGIPLEKAVQMVTQTPAQIIREPGKGQIAKGMDADICVMDSNFQVKLTIVGGRICYVRQ